MSLPFKLAAKILLTADQLPSCRGCKYYLALFAYGHFVGYCGNPDIPLDSTNVKEPCDLFDARDACILSQNTSVSWAQSTTRGESIFDSTDE